MTFQQAEEFYFRSLLIPKPVIQIENTKNRDSKVPVTQYRIVYRIANRIRELTIPAQSPLKALRTFKELHAILYDKCEIQEIL